MMATLRLARCVYKRNERPPTKNKTEQNKVGDSFSKLYQVTPQTQLSRPVTLGHYTSWDTDSAGNKSFGDVTAAADPL